MHIRYQSEMFLKAIAYTTETTHFCLLNLPDFTENLVKIITVNIMPLKYFWDKINATSQKGESSLAFYIFS